MSSVNGESTATPVWTNEFPQQKLGWLSFDPISLALGIPILVGSLFADTASLRATFILLGLAIILIGLPHAQNCFANRRLNFIELDRDGRSVVSAQVIYENRVSLALMLLAFSGLTFVLGYFAPFSDLPQYGARDRGKEVFFLYTSPFFAISGLTVLGQRPWRRRLVFSSDGLAYRRFGPTVFIPWDTIDTVTPVDDTYLQAAVITARPPAQQPALERKQLPDGATRAKLAIYGMTVDPATIVYLIRRFAADPDARELLATSKYPERLFTGPSWDQRVAMEDGQTWPTPRLDDLAAD